MTTSGREPRPLITRKFTSPDEVQGGINLLAPCLQEVDDLLRGQVPSVPATLEALAADIRSRVLEVFGPDSLEFREARASFCINLHTFKSPQQELVARLQREHSVLSRMIRRLQEKLEQFVDQGSQGVVTTARFSCFLGYSFTEMRATTYAGQVERFLRLIEVGVFTGRDYQPRGITEKVRAKLDAADLAVAIFTADSAGIWCRDELARVHNSGRPVIPLVEEGASFPPGLFGDHEWIRFAKDHIGDTFLPLLEGLSFIERAHAQAAEQAAEQAPEAPGEGQAAT